MAIDGAAQPGTFSASGTQDFPFPCDASPHAYLLTAFAADGRTVTQNKAIAQAP
jgi:hypothetical protein